MTTEYIVVIPIDDMPLGAEYGPSVVLPLHCTLMPWFEVGIHDPKHIHEAVSLFASEVDAKYLELVSDQPALFDPANSVPVHTLVRNEPLLLLHTKLLLFLAAIDAEPTQLQWVGAGYQPHVTTVGDRAFPPGSVYRAQYAVIVERGSDQVKKVLSVHPFRY